MSDMQLSNNVSSRARITQALYAILFAGVLVMVIVALVLGTRSREWQFFGMTAAGVLLNLALGASFALYQRGRREWASAVVLGGLAAALALVTAFFADMGTLMTLMAIFLGVFFVIQMLSDRAVVWGVLAAVAGGVVITLTDLFAGPIQLRNIVLFRISLAMASLIVVSFIAFLLRQFRLYPLASKLLATYLVVALVPTAAVVLLLTQPFRQTGAASADYAFLAQQSQMGSIALLISTVAVAALALLITRQINRPVSTLAEAARQIAAGELAARAEVETEDEIGELAQSFNLMTDQLRNLISTLEERVATRTRDLTTVAEVSTATSTILETGKLLQAVVDLTKERFGLYHAHIYLLDEAGETLALAAGAGEPGRQMVARGHAIPLERERSLVARAARERTGVIANDVIQEPDFLPNPLLPETRAEMAVPMIVGGNVLGVFDVQSEQVGRFSEADVSVYTTLAAQVAVSVQNVRSFEKARAQAELESMVNAIGQQIQRAATVQDTLQTTVRELGQILAATRVRIAIGVNPGQSDATRQIADEEI